MPKTIPSLITSSIGQCELDLRQVLLGNVVLTGGGSLFAGFADRLANDMGRAFQHVSATFALGIDSLLSSFLQVKIHAPGNPTERRYGGWLGGSILASLGTFHQLWISKEEWQVRYLLSDIDHIPSAFFHLFLNSSQSSWLIGYVGTRFSNCWTAV